MGATASRDAYFAFTFIHLLSAHADSHLTGFLVIPGGFPWFPWVFQDSLLPSSNIHPANHVRARAPPGSGDPPDSGCASTYPIRTVSGQIEVTPRSRRSTRKGRSCLTRPKLAPKIYSSKSRVPAQRVLHLPSAQNCPPSRDLPKVPGPARKTLCESRNRPSGRKCRPKRITCPQ